MNFDEKHIQKYTKIGEKTYSMLAGQLIPGSYIDRKNKELAKTNTRSLGTASTIMRGVKLVEQVCRSTNLGTNVEKRAAYLLSEYFDDIKHGVRLAVASIAGASILFAVREFGIPVPFREIYNAIKMRGKRITVSKMIRAYREYVTLVGYEPQRSSPEMFIERLCNSLSSTLKGQVTEKQQTLLEIKEAAKRCIERTPNDMRGGKNPYVLAAGALCYVLFYTKYRKFTSIKSMAAFSRIVNVTEYSLNEYAKMMEKHAIR